MIATATAAVTTVTRRCDGAAMTTVMDSNGRCNGNTTIGKRLGERILAPKRQDFDAVDNMRDKLRDEYVVEIDDQNKDGEGDESNIVSREEWEDGEAKDRDANGSVDFVNGGGGAKNKDKETENDAVMMEDDDSDSGGALLSSLSDLLDEHASLSTMTNPDCPRAEGEALGGRSAGEREEERAYCPSSLTQESNICKPLSDDNIKMVLFCVKTRIVAKDPLIDPADGFSLLLYSDNSHIFLQNNSCALSVVDSN